MLFTLKRPKSERFFQLSFNGFRLRGRNKIEKTFYILWDFIKALLWYFRRKVVFLGVLVKKLFIGIRLFTRNAKDFMVRKLIWGRGRLGRPVATMIIMTSAFFVFFFGEVLNSSRFVSSQEISQDYLKNVTDIIPPQTKTTTFVPESRRTDPVNYTIEGGDTLYGIGQKFKISTDAIKYVNNLTDSSVLKPGQEIVIPPIAGIIHEVEKGDTIQSIADKYEVPSQSIADFNYILDISSLAVGTELIIPDAKIPEPVAPVPAVVPGIFNVPSRAPDLGSGWCMWPTSTRILTQYFSVYHNGVDIATPWGSLPPLYACAGGSVTRAGWDPWGLGLHVKIDHGNGYETVYGHMSQVYVSYGDSVDKGEAIGIMGNTGRSTGPHVHFIVEYNGVPQNPLNYIN